MFVEPGEGTSGLTCRANLLQQLTARGKFIKNCLLEHRSLLSHVVNHASFLCRLCFEEASQWSYSLARLLSSKCKSAAEPSVDIPSQQSLNSAHFPRLFRWTENLPGLLEVRVQRWKLGVLDDVWGLQKDQVFLQDVRQGQKDLQMLHWSWGSQRGMRRAFL